ncbi:hypothetical protein MHM88_14600 [Epibacterium sp. MM17-32]|uniref:hypothetical protein n=1 Tax=Epibacterium sp. MM17-32 TaxID=2917734 RepID=UPI001EF60BD0|nr:hypothetical protein [Epibacterium sp. MM17-32]MCG7629038.1 hypothetical protein [Epibacterium sp. MM17-32]
MGDIAEAMLWGEMNGRDMECPEDWLNYYEDSAPPSPDLIADEGRLLLAWIREHTVEGEEGLETWEVLEELFPGMDNGQSQAVATGLEILASFHKEDI